jgi:hypothetical protein
MRRSASIFSGSGDNAMPFVPAPNIIMVEWRYVLAGQKCENRMMWDVLSVPSHPDLIAFATFAWDWWENTYAAQITTSCLLSAVVVTYMGDENGDQYTYAPDTTTTGDVSSQALPNETSLCISLRSGLRGRSARGRWYMCGIPIAALVDANNVSTTYASAAVAALQTLIDDVTTGGNLPSIVSYISNNAPRVGGPVYFTIETALLVDTVVDSQRRRKPGVGQ